MLVSHNQNADQNHNIKIANRSFENVSQFRCLGMTVTNQNLIQEETMKRLNSGNACYNSVQNLFPSHPLSKSLKLEYIILTVVLYKCETWSVTLREEHGLRVLESRVLRRIYGLKRDWSDGWVEEIA
jgi:hypothetical protein